MIKVRNMRSSRGNAVANQFIIEADDWEIFQSYGSVIAKKMYDGSGKTYIDENYWDYSRTTGKYRNDFLGENRNITQMKINSGEYILTDLNK